MVVVNLVELKQNTITIESAAKLAKYAKTQTLLGVAHETDQNLERIGNLQQYENKTVEIGSLNKR